MTFEIERLKLEELRAFLQKQADEAFPDLKDEVRLNMLAEKWAKNAEICTCRDDDGSLIGMIAFYANRPENVVAYIPHVYVNSEYRGKNLFSSMLLLVEDYVKEKGFSIIRLEVGKNNEKAQRAYFHNGFKLIGEGSEGSYCLQYEVS